MDTVNVFLLLLLCCLSAADLQDNHIQETEQRAVSVKVDQSCPSDVHTLLRELSVRVAVLQANMENLQRQNQEQADKLKEVDALKLQQHDQANKLKEVDALKLQQQEQADKLSQVKLQQQEQADKLSQVKLQQQDQAAELKSLKTWSNVTETHVDSLRRDRAVRKVAFSASLRTSGEGHSGPINAFTPLVFRNVISNIGNAYNPNTGDFIAPVRGVYHFELYIAGLGNSHDSGAGLLKNGQHVVIAYESEARNWGQACNGASLLLEVNDIVSVRLWAHTRIYENHNRHNTFSGRLLFTM